MTLLTIIGGVLLAYVGMALTALATLVMVGFILAIGYGLYAGEQRLRRYYRG